jgi:hypothetical protein
MPWSTIEALAKTGATEVMINFPMDMAIRRMMPKSGDVPPDWDISVTTFFGSPDWRNYAYEEVDELIGPRVRKIADSEVRLLEWYRERLRDIRSRVTGIAHQDHPAAGGSTTWSGLAHMQPASPAPTTF